MSKISFYRDYSPNGEIFVERLSFGSPTWNDGADRITSAVFSLGEWLCEFISVDTEHCEEYVDQFEFSDQEKLDSVYSHRIISIFMNSYPITLNKFQRFMIEKGLNLPKSNFEIGKLKDIQESYECSNIMEFCTVLLFHALKLKRSFKQCQNCAKWFVPQKKSDEKYCLRQSPQYPDKNCRDAARLIRTLEIRHSDDVTRLLKNIRQMRSNGAKISPEFDNNIIWRKKYKSGEISNDEYVQWLKSIYKRKYK